MKLVKILAVLVIVIFIGDSLKDAFSGAIDGWNEAGERKIFSGQVETLSVKADRSVAVDSLFNQTMNQKSPYRIEEIGTEVELPVANTLFYFFVVFPACLFALYGVYCMIRVILSVTRGDVFSRKNVRRMRFFIYSFLLAMACMEVYCYLNYQEAVSQIRLSGYEIVSYTIKYSWLPYVILALFTEIFAVGVKIKEEQDLTI